VFSEPLSSKPEYYLQQIKECNGEWNTQMLKEFIDCISVGVDMSNVIHDCNALSTRRLIDDVWNNFASSI